jgi:hypothetical protein
MPCDRSHTHKKARSASFLTVRITLDKIITHDLHENAEAELPKR